MNWGLIGYGIITPQFAASLKLVKDETIYAIASHSNGDQIKKDYPESKVYNNYDAIYADENIDIVYIGTPHNFHIESVINCLENGKHVVCEKPLGVNPEEARTMIDCAKKNNKFLLEGMWTRFLPGYRKMKEILDSGVIGEINLVQADFSIHIPRDDNHRAWSPNLAGGSLLDLGVYPVGLINDVFGEMPEDIAVFGNVVDTGVDQSIAAQMRYKSGANAQIYSGLNGFSQWKGTIYGQNGWIVLDEFFRGQNLTYKVGEKVKKVSLPYKSTGFYHEIVEAVNCIENGQIECELFSHTDTLANADLVQRIFNELK